MKNVRSRRLGNFTRLLIVLAGCLLTACAPGQFAVTNTFGLPGSIGGVCAAYFTIENPIDQADVLIGASSEVAAATEIHTTVTNNGVIEMKPQPRVEVPAHGQVKFEPGGLHIMFVNLARDLKPGDTFPLTLRFQQRGEIQIQVTVKEL
jgi:copper(I)-binding protein